MPIEDGKLYLSIEDKGYSDENKKKIKRINSDLYNMATYLSRFAYNIELRASILKIHHHVLELTKGRNNKSDASWAWQSVPLRDSVLAMHFFIQSLQRLNGKIKRWRTAPSTIDAAAINTACGTLHRLFPHVASMRNGVAHEADIEQARNLTIGPITVAGISLTGSSSAIILHYHHSTITVTVDGTAHSLDVDAGTLRPAFDAYEKVYDAIVQNGTPVSQWGWIPEEIKKL